MSLIQSFMDDSLNQTASFLHSFNRSTSQSVKVNHQSIHYSFTHSLIHSCIHQFMCFINFTLLHLVLFSSLILNILSLPLLFRFFDSYMTLFIIHNCLGKRQSLRIHRPRVSLCIVVDVLEPASCDQSRQHTGLHTITVTSAGAWSWVHQNRACLLPDLPCEISRDMFIQCCLTLPSTCQF